MGNKELHENEFHFEGIDWHDAAGIMNVYFGSGAKAPDKVYVVVDGIEWLYTPPSTNGGGDG